MEREGGIYIRKYLIHRLGTTQAGGQFLDSKVQILGMREM